MANDSAKLTQATGIQNATYTEIIISIPRSRLLKSFARFIIERSEIRKKQNDFKSVHFDCRMVLFYMIWEKSRLFFHRM